LKDEQVLAQVHAYYVCCLWLDVASSDVKHVCSFMNEVICKR